MAVLTEFYMGSCEQEGARRVPSRQVKRGLDPLVSMNVCVSTFISAHRVDLPNNGRTHAKQRRPAREAIAMQRPENEGTVTFFLPLLLLPCSSSFHHILSSALQVNNELHHHHCRKSTWLHAGKESAKHQFDTSTDERFSSYQTRSGERGIFQGSFQQGSTSRSQTLSSFSNAENISTSESSSPRLSANAPATAYSVSSTEFQHLC
ncbi:hypothetical protein T439DRAFT_97915 [Meredithblackwellia eburnea MCA 4105]